MFLVCWIECGGKEVRVGWMIEFYVCVVSIGGGECLCMLLWDCVGVVVLILAML